MENIQDAATMVCVVLAIFAGVGARWAWVLDRRDAAIEAQENNQSEGTN